MHSYFWAPVGLSSKILMRVYRDQAKLAVKDSYSFDFLELEEKHSERELEKALINQVKEFLVELGSYFTFIGSQYHLEVGNQ